MSLQVIDVTKRYKGDTVLNGVSLEAAAGETIVLFGPSGAGKTVMLRVIAGVMEADEGRILIGDQDMTAAEPEERGIGMAFQNFALVPHLTARENIATPLVAQRRPAAEIDARVREVGDLLKIGHVLDHHPKALSNGQKQRTALGRALAGTPSVLLLDDPLRNVDAKLRFEMRLELPRLLKDGRTTVVYVTQDYKEAMALGDRIAVLGQGRIEQVGTPSQIYLEPATVGIARLFGDPVINLLDVVPRAGADGTVVEVAGTEIVLDAGYSGAAGRTCTLGLRPEALRFVQAGTSGAFAVEVEAETPLNEKVVTLIEVEGHGEMLLSRPNGTPGPASGTAHVALAPEAAGGTLLFEREGGRRVVPSGRARAAA